MEIIGPTPSQPKETVESYSKAILAIENENALEPSSKEPSLTEISPTANMKAADTLFDPENSVNAYSVNVGCANTPLDFCKKMAANAELEHSKISDTSTAENADLKAKDNIDSGSQLEESDLSINTKTKEPPPQSTDGAHNLSSTTDLDVQKTDVSFEPNEHTINLQNDCEEVDELELGK
ncbi:hypothetical protein DM860_004845 [Cuscuta australis]|uniref:Uncharacterized protein n=1 Tax=Cuscuta australis TaxID=267555 RepID=A0A328DM57_9ASTE|nr:hypothetical protein DM860_004845 [Cuscuta australis]